MKQFKNPIFIASVGGWVKPVSDNKEKGVLDHSVNAVTSNGRYVMYLGKKRRDFYRSIPRIH